MGKILNFLGLKWVKSLLTVLAVGGTVWLLVKGFFMLWAWVAFSNPVVKQLQTDFGIVATNDSLKSVQLYELQTVIRDLRQAQVTEVDSLKSERDRTVKELQRIIKEQRDIINCDAITLEKRQARIDSFYAHGGRSCYREEKVKRTDGGWFPGKEWVLVEIDCNTSYPIRRK